MDALKKKVQQATGGMNLGSGSGAGAANTDSANASGGKEDYVDKAFDFAAKKASKPMDRNSEEKMTDAGRGLYEKMTGKSVNPKVSN